MLSQAFLLRPEDLRPELFYVRVYGQGEESSPKISNKKG